MDAKKSLVLRVVCKDGKEVPLEEEVWKQSTLFVNMVSDLPDCSEPFPMDFDSHVVERFCSYVRTRNARPPGTDAAAADESEFPLQTEEDAKAAANFTNFVHMIDAKEVTEAMINRFASLARGFSPDGLMSSLSR